MALAMVYEVAGSVDLPIVGCGGITCASDAIEFIMAGASAVQIGTASFANPRAPLDVLEGIERFMEKEGIEDIAELIGAARSSQDLRRRPERKFLREFQKTAGE